MNHREYLQVEKERVQREKLIEESKRVIRERKKKHESIPSKPSRISLSIKFKGVRRINVKELVIPTISLKELKLSKLNALPVSIMPTNTCIPRLSIPSIKKIASIRFPIFEPLSVQVYAPLQLKIKVKPIQDISVRPVIESEKISLTERLNVFLGSKKSPVLHPKILPSNLVKQIIPLKPNLKLKPKELSESTVRLIEKHTKPAIHKTTPEVKEEQTKLLQPGFSGLPEELLDEKFLDEEYHKLGGLGGIASEGLICILVEKYRDFHELIKLLCAKIWRIKSEGLPRVSITSYSEELGWRGLSENIIELDLVERLISDLAQKGPSALNKARDAFINEIKAKSIEGRLRFLILPIDRELFEKAYDLLTKPELRVERYLRHAKFFAFKLKKVDERFLGRMLISAFGFADTPIHSLSIGEYALELEGKFYKKLEQVMNQVKKKVDPIYWPKPGDEVGQRESWLHWALKHLVYSHLINNLMIDERNIKSEVSIIKGKVTDIVCETSSKRIAIEIETMYGTGDPIGLKINPYTIKPYYLEKHFEGELWIVVPNLHALIYANDLIRLRNCYRREGLDLEIYVADVTGIGSKLIYNEKRKPGLIKLIDMLKYIKGKA